MIAKPANCRCLLPLLLLACSLTTAQAQWVTIPDANFANFLQTKIPACMNGNQMDTTCPGVTNTRALYPVSRNIQDLTGIQYFDSLDSLNCRNNRLTWLPPLPKGLGQLTCDYNQLTALPQLPDSMWWLKADHNQLTSVQPVLPQTLRTLWLSHNQLTSLPAFPPILWTVDVSYNQITTIPSPLPSTLQWLTCGHNLLTALPSFHTVTDTYLNIECEYNQITSLPTLERVNSVRCNNNLLTSLPPLSFGTYWGVSRLYCQSNQISVLPPFPGYFTDLNCSNNPITVIPPMPRVERVWCHDMPLLTTITELGAWTYVFDCRNTPNLKCLPELAVRDTFRFTGSGITCLPNYPPVTYSIPAINTMPLCDDIFNQNGCSVYWNISGKSYREIDGNCSQNPSTELYIPNLKVGLYNNAALVQQAYTGGSGVYSFDTDLDTFTITIDITNTPFQIKCPANGINTSTITPADSTDVDKDFGMECKPGFDVGAWSVATEDWFFPARLAYMEVHAGDWAEFWNQNCNTDSLSGQLVTTITGPAAYVSPAPGARAPDNVSGNTLIYNISNWEAVNPTVDFNVLVRTDTSAQSGQQVCFVLTIIPITGDNNVANNNLTHCFTVVNSYDPNDKQVSPVGNVDTTQEWLTYTVRFQNTGTAAAQHIYIDDTLDTDLDESTFQLLAYSHQPLTQLTQNAVRFNFPNINLPDSTSDEPGSHGYVQYKVKLKENLPLGTAIENTAAIYFDFNPPVITNTVVNTIGIDTNCTTAITTNNSDSIYCRLDTITLTAHNAEGVSYLWSTGATTASITETFTTATTYTYQVTVTDAGNCVSSDTITFTVNPIPFVGPGGPPPPAICPGISTVISAPATSDFYAWSTGDSTRLINVAPLVTTDYTVTVTNSYGCSIMSTMRVDVVVVPAAISPAQTMICLGDGLILAASGGVSYAWSHGETDSIIMVNPAVSTTYTVTVTDGAGCTAAATATVGVNHDTASLYQLTICEGESYFFNDTSISVAGTYIDTFFTTGGCDSVVTLELTVLDNSTYMIAHTMCAGASYFFNNQNLTAAGSYYDTLVNVAGCDSLITLHLSVTGSSAGSFSESICAGQSYFFNNQNLTTSGIYHDTLPDANSCDSIVTLTLTVSSGTTGSLSETICTGGSYFFNNQNLTTNGIYYDTLLNSNSCDSIVTLQLTVNNGSTASLSAAVCAGDSYTFNGQHLTASGVYYDTLPNSNGCDSIIALTLTVHALPQPVIARSNDTLSTGSFSSYQWLFNGNAIHGATSQQLRLTQNGDYHVVVSDGNGCGDTSDVYAVTDFDVYYPFPMEDAEWEVVNYIFEGSTPFYYHYWLDGDTIINNYHYAKLYSWETNGGLQGLIGGLREDYDKKVYFRNFLNYSFLCSPQFPDSLEEIVLYDFGLEAGETALFFDTSIYSGACFNPRSVTFIDSVLIFGEDRKRRSVQGGGLLGGGEWIEGVGSEAGLFGTYAQEFENDWALCSFEKGGQVWNPSNLACTVGINEKQTPSLSLVPNPTTNTITITIDAAITGSTLSITDIAGKLLTREQLNSASTQYNTAHFANGIYFVTVTTKDGSSVTKKLVKH